MKVSYGIGCVLVFCLSVSSCKQQLESNNQVTTPSKSHVVTATSRFKFGQIWTFRIPTNEFPNAVITIMHVDFDSEEGPIIYASIKGHRPLILEAPMIFPFSEDALNRSVLALVDTNAPITGEDLQFFQDCYEAGRQAVKAGEVEKCFKITVAEVLENRRKSEDLGKMQ